MNFRRLLIIITFFPALIFSQAEYTSFVNPFIGTGGHGHTFPGATLPFGMVALSPDTRVDGTWDGCSGYHYSDKLIYGFSHTHLSGTGCSDYGDVLIMPTVGLPSINNKQYASRFSHAKEAAQPGYYSVMLDNSNIKAELTSTLRTGIHRYTFPKTNKGNIILDLLHRDKTLASNIRVLDSVTISGFRISEAWAKEQYVYFIMRFSKPFRKMEYARKGKFQKALDKTKKEMAEGAYFEFDVSDGKPLMIKVAMSLTNTDGALLNMEAEAPHWDFEKYRSDANATWNKELSKIDVPKTNLEKATVFYTALYHCMIHPSLNMDVDGKYRGRDNRIHIAEGFNYYSVFSLWDTFRALHPLFTIIDQKRTNDFINTFLKQYDQGKRLPVWELSSNETDCMIGYHSVSVITDAYMKNIKNYDTLRVLEAMKAASNHEGYGLPDYARQGYLQVDDESESVSKTLEYAYDDWCISQFEKKANVANDNLSYTKRAQSYKQLFDPTTGFMRPRKNGGWLMPFDPKEVNNHFTEANCWQYSFFVPQDINTLIKFHGGDKAFEQKLDQLFLESAATTGRKQDDISGLIGQYAHGNEPSHHMAYLYNFVGKPQKTIERTSQILNTFYANKPDGLIGNEDCGQMSAWYVLSAMGFYPVCPGNPNYVLGKPLFDEITIHLENGKDFKIHSSPTASQPFVSGITLNSVNSLKSFISHSDISNGGDLTFNYAAKNDSTNTYGSASENRPQNIINSNLVLQVPLIEGASRSFKDKQEIKIISPLQNAKLVYTLDGTEPIKTSPVYSKPLMIDSTCKVKAKLYTENDSSNTTTASFFKAPHNWKIKLKSKYNRQYTAGGDEGIIDGIYGDVNWRKGEWQGYQSQNFEGIIDLGKVQSVSKFSSNFLQDSRSWILFPTEVNYFGSVDGINFSLIGKTVTTIKPDDYLTQLKKFELTTPQPIKVRYIKVQAKNFGKLPAWHQGVGGDAFIFIDEIEVK